VAENEKYAMDCALNNEYYMYIKKEMPFFTEGHFSFSLTVNSNLHSKMMSKTLEIMSIYVYNVVKCNFW
jgi:hypothetical protein